MNKRTKQTNPMTQLMLRRVLVLGMLIMALCVFDCTSSKVAGDIPFQDIVIDDQTWGIRSIGDIDGDDMVWEREPLERLAKDGQLIAYRHTSFWQCMDTLREKCILESLWQSGKAPWKIWED